MIRKIFGASIISLLILQFFYVYFEAGPVNAATVSDNVIVSLVVDAGLTITSPVDVSMSPNISMSANGSIGSTAWTVRTNSPTGYTLALKASASPALVSGANSFADYTEASNGTPEVWSVPSGSKEFGFSAYGTDVAGGTAVWGTGAGCGSSGTPLGTMKYIGFETTDKTVASTSTVTPVAGGTTNVCFAAEQDGIYAASGTYTATITATATTT
jgi:hypothetical protein